MTKSRSLTQTLVDDFTQQVALKQLKTGDKLPTEMSIMQTFGVSRTVVREALSKLQAAGLVETHHGIGTFVLEPSADSRFRMSGVPLISDGDVQTALEFRLGIEVECAGLAALRRTPEQLKAMRTVLDEFEQNLAEKTPKKATFDQSLGNTVAPDFQFHLLLAQAAHNRYFVDLMSHLGTSIIPRSRLAIAKKISIQMPAYLSRVNQEHETIYQAVVRQDAESARAAARLHLTNSRERMRLAQAD